MSSIFHITNAFKSLIANKKRSFLTMLGIIIGIASVIIIFSVGAGAQSLIVNQLSSIGSDLIGILPGASDESGPPASVLGIVVTTLVEEDLEALQRQLPVEIEAVSGYVQGTATLQAGSARMDANFFGVSASYTDVEEAKVTQGRFFSSDEARGSARTAVIGSEVAEELFGQEDPLGRRIRVRNENFSVIGVFEPRGTSGFINQDNKVFIPLRTAQKLLLGIEHLSFARVRASSGADLPQVSENIKQVLRAEHGIANPENDDFSVRNTDQALDVLGSITQAISLFLGAIGGVSLIVGGIGVMNIMLVNVGERIKEIGLRKAVGARRKVIRNQFLTEAIILTVIGGLAGIAIGVVFSGLIALGARSFELAWSFSIPVFSIVLALVVTVMVGLFFGLYPARKAAELNPIDALRHE